MLPEVFFPRCSPDDSATNGYYIENKIIIKKHAYAENKNCSKIIDACPQLMDYNSP
jgi:hypothetical protein